MRAGLVAVGLAGTTASCALDAATLCAAAGGAYTDRTCIRWSPGLQAAQDACAAVGGVYLGGQDTCAFGAGGQ